MITRFWFGNRREGLTAEAFSDHWFHTHAAFGLALPGLRAYVQNPRDLDAPPGWAPPFDGCSELDFDSVDAMASAFDSPAIVAADVDEREFADPDRYVVAATERQVWYGGEVADPPVRVLHLLRAAAGVDAATLLPAVLAADGVAAARQTGALRAEALPAVEVPGVPRTVDLVLSLWFGSAAGALAAVPAWSDRIAADTAGLVLGRELALVRPRRLR